MDILRGEAEALREADQIWAERLNEIGWAQLPVAVQRRRILEQLTASDVPFEFDLVERLRRTPEVPWSVGPHRSVQIDCEGKLTVKAEIPMLFQGGEVLMDLRARNGHGFLGDRAVYWRVVVAREGDRTAWQRYAAPTSEVFDADRIGQSVRLRHWRAGDRFRPIGLRKATKLQDLFVSNKIPRAARHHLLVAEAIGGALCWVEGLRIGHDYRVTAGTRRLLIWSWRHP
jgi:tRNA(Ile)-lysidine synthase